MTIWKSLPDYEDIYEVSDSGQIRTCAGKTTFSKKHGVRHWKQRVLKQKTDKGGYKRVSLWKDGMSKDYLVHRIVAGAFLQKEDGKDIVNHKDCNPGNNSLTNLEWTNYTGNLLHDYDNRLNTEAKPVILFDLKSKSSRYFRSYAEASQFLNKNNGYLLAIIARGKKKVGNYEIYLQV